MSRADRAGLFASVPAKEPGVQFSHRLVKAAVGNPFEAFPAEECDDWLEGLKSKLRNALNPNVKGKARDPRERPSARQSLPAYVSTRDDDASLRYSKDDLDIEGISDSGAEQTSDDAYDIDESYAFNGQDQAQDTETSQNGDLQYQEGEEEEYYAEEEEELDKENTVYPHEFFAEDEIEPLEQIPIFSELVELLDTDEEELAAHGSSPPWDDVSAEQDAYDEQAHDYPEDNDAEVVEAQASPPSDPYSAASPEVFEISDDDEDDAANQGPSAPMADTHQEEDQIDPSLLDSAADTYGLSSQPQAGDAGAMWLEPHPLFNIPMPLTIPSGVSVSASDFIPDIPIDFFGADSFTSSGAFAPGLLDGLSAPGATLLDEHSAQAILNFSQGAHPRFADSQDSAELSESEQAATQEAVSTLAAEYDDSQLLHEDLQSTPMKSVSPTMTADAEVIDLDANEDAEDDQLTTENEIQLTIEAPADEPHTSASTAYEQSGELPDHGAHVADDTHLLPGEQDTDEPVKRSRSTTPVPQSQPARSVPASPHLFLEQDETVAQAMEALQEDTSEAATERVADADAALDGEADDADVETQLPGRYDESPAVQHEHSALSPQPKQQEISKDEAEGIVEEQQHDLLHHEDDDAFSPVGNDIPESEFEVLATQDVLEEDGFEPALDSKVEPTEIQSVQDREEAAPAGRNEVDADADADADASGESEDEAYNAPIAEQADEVAERPTLRTLNSVDEVRQQLDAATYDEEEELIFEYEPEGVSSTDDTQTAEATLATQSDERPTLRSMDSVDDIAQQLDAASPTGHDLDFTGMPSQMSAFLQEPDVGDITQDGEDLALAVDDETALEDASIDSALEDSTVEDEPEAADWSPQQSRSRKRKPVEKLPTSSPKRTSARRARTVSQTFMPAPASARAGPSKRRAGSKTPSAGSPAEDSELDEYGAATADADPETTPRGTRRKLGEDAEFVNSKDSPSRRGRGVALKGKKRKRDATPELELTQPASIDADAHQVDTSREAEVSARPALSRTEDFRHYHGKNKQAGMGPMWKSLKNAIKPVTELLRGTAAPKPIKPVPIVQPTAPAVASSSTLSEVILQAPAPAPSELVVEQENKVAEAVADNQHAAAPAPADGPAVSEDSVGDDEPTPTRDMVDQDSLDEDGVTAALSLDSRAPTPPWSSPEAEQLTPPSQSEIELPQEAPRSPPRLTVETAPVADRAVSPAPSPALTSPPISPLTPTEETEDTSSNALAVPSRPRLSARIPSLNAQSRVTRSHCQFHTVSVPSSDGLRAYFITPACSIADTPKMRELDAIDHDIATAEDHQRCIIDLEYADEEAVHAIRKLVGLELLREGEVGYRLRDHESYAQLMARPTNAYHILKKPAGRNSVGGGSVQRRRARAQSTSSSAPPSEIGDGSESHAGSPAAHTRSHISSSSPTSPVGSRRPVGPLHKRRKVDQDGYRPSIEDLAIEDLDQEDDHKSLIVKTRTRRKKPVAASSSPSQAAAESEAHVANASNGAGHKPTSKASRKRKSKLPVALSAAEEETDPIGAESDLPPASRGKKRPATEDGHASDADGTATKKRKVSPPIQTFKS
ncbi:hypothetical protein BKA62DRAFT_698224 [Auriculariales sp. MPI-PUGE-AT-0066]|nr:hypothetical protein BKA62DRAFT_698224 [Auriculariales sp. MPI-PUGE-AT-0066]